MKKSLKLSYPEVETRAAARGDEFLDVNQLYQAQTTLVDLLEIGTTPAGKVLWKEGLDHDSLIRHFNGGDPHNSEPVLRVLFLSTITSDPATEIFNQLQVSQTVRLQQSTVDWMRDHLGVSPIFIDCITRNMVLKAGDFSFCKRSDVGDTVSIDGFYQYSYGLTGAEANSWFSHNVQTRSSTYILHNCSGSAKRLIQSCAFGDQAHMLGRLCAIDAFIAEDCSQAWGDESLGYRNQLLRYEYMRFDMHRFSPQATWAAVENLHHISQTLHIIYENMIDLEELLEFLRDLRKQYLAHSPRHEGGESVGESLQFLTARTKHRRRWAVNYKERTEIRINLFFNLATQNDSRTNLDIASFTSKIAVDTQRDSSSMITIAAVTMFFLPGTFVSALFSMVFFNSGTDSNGQTTITVSPQWWYFIVITIPLTVVVFAVWVFWQRWRNNSIGIGTVASTRETIPGSDMDAFMGTLDDKRY